MVRVLPRAEVVNGGLTAGALAFADALPQLSAAVLGNATKGIQSAFSSYGPSGAWTEGLGYWGYGTNYALVYIDSMLTATGSDGGASASPGLNETGLFCLHGVGPSWKIYNWGDSGSGGCDEAVVQQLVIDRWTSVCLCDFCFCQMYDFDRQKGVYRATDGTPFTSNREHFIRLCGLFTLRLSANYVLLIRTQREMLILQIYFLRCEVRSR